MRRRAERIDRTQRASAIWSELLAGATYAAIARQHRLTLRGAKLIVARMRRLAQLDLFKKGD